MIFYHLCLLRGVLKGKERRRKEGRKEGREKGREKGRKGRRETGRKREKERRRKEWGKKRKSKREILWYNSPNIFYYWIWLYTKSPIWRNKEKFKVSSDSVNSFFRLFDELKLKDVYTLEWPIWSLVFNLLVHDWIIVKDFFKFCYWCQPGN